jgi:hypothetical protein
VRHPQADVRQQPVGHPPQAQVRLGDEELGAAGDGRGRVREQPGEQLVEARALLRRQPGRDRRLAVARLAPQVLAGRPARGGQ